MHLLLSAQLSFANYKLFFLLMRNKTNTLCKERRFHSLLRLNNLNNLINFKTIYSLAIYCIAIRDNKSGTRV